MIRIQRAGERFAAAEGGRTLASCDFSLRGNTVLLGAPAYAELPVVDGVFRACLDYFERRGYLDYGPADEAAAAAFAALGYTVCQVGETGGIAAFFETCNNCKN